MNIIFLRSYACYAHLQPSDSSVCELEYNSLEIERP